MIGFLFIKENKMINSVFFFLSFIFFCLSFLNPIHMNPWAGFFSEVFAFIALFLLIPLLFKQKVKINKITIPFLIVMFIPMIQYFCGQIIFFSNALLSTLYIFIFLLAVIIGSNLVTQYNDRKQNFNLISFLAWILLLSGVISAAFAILQWLNLTHMLPVIMELYGNRPYANMAQPNHLATLLNLAIFSSYYLYEKDKIKSPIFYLSIISLIFAVALTQSRTGYLIFISGIIFLFIFKRKLNLKLPTNKLILGIVYFLNAIILLPKLTIYLSHFFDIKYVASIVERATSGFERFKIWNQMIHAILNQPWFGYGWNQTTSAQFSVIDLYHGQEWATSSHNLFIDILVWCGLPIGLLVSGFIIWFYISIFKNILSLEKLFAFLVVSTLGLHSLLEYPLYYSFFLIPLGLFCGISLIDNCEEDKYQIDGKYLILVFVSGILIFVGVCRDYFKVEDNLFAGRLHAMGNLQAEVKLPEHLYMLDSFEQRAKWLALYPKMNVNSQQIMNAQKIIRTSLKPYDIHKYAQLMAYNNNKSEALRMLVVLKVMYGIEFTYDDLVNDHKPSVDEIVN